MSGERGASWRTCVRINRCLKRDSRPEDVNVMMTGDGHPGISFFYTIPALALADMINRGKKKLSALGATMTVFFTILFTLASSFAIKFLIDGRWWIPLGIVMAVLSCWFLFMVSEQDSNSYKNQETLEILVKGIMPAFMVASLICSLLTFRRSSISTVFLFIGTLLVVFGEIKLLRHQKFVRGRLERTSGTD